MSVIVFDRGHAFDPEGFSASTNIFRTLSSETNYTVVYNEPDGWIVQLATPTQGVTYIGFFPPPGEPFLTQDDGAPFGWVDQIELADAFGDTFVFFADLPRHSVAALLIWLTADDIVEEADDFFGSPDADTLFAGPGDDTLDGLEGADTLHGEDGLDFLLGFSGDDALFGEADADTIFGEDGADAISGGAGDDWLYGGAGADSLNGGTDFDVASYSDAAGGVVVTLTTSAAQDTGGAGIDTLIGVEGLEGSDFGDTLTGSSAANVLLGGLGVDVITGGAGDDTLGGGAGDDSIDGGDGFDLASYVDAFSGVTVTLASQGVAQDTGGAGFDTLIGIEQLQGSFANDALTGSSAADALFGDAGDDTLDGGAGADLLDGGDGADLFVQAIEASIDTLSGGEGFDIIDYSGASAGVNVQLGAGYAASGGVVIALFDSIEDAAGSAFDDALIGSDADNFLCGFAGSDWLVGGAGNDGFFQEISAGVDRLFGDAGVDFIDYTAASAGVVVQLSGYATSGGALLATFSGIEDVYGSGFNDTLVGNGAGNLIYGGVGADWLVGGAGDDRFWQDADTTSVDRLFGDSGIDLLDYSGASAGVTVQLSGYAVSGGATIATFAGIEDARGTDFADVLIGNGANNAITGGAGADWLVGGAGDDVFFQAGGGGVDRIFGDSGIDAIDFSAASGGVLVQLSGSAMTVAGAVLLATFSGVESVVGTSFDDRLIGVAADNRLNGGAGADLLIGGGGGDAIFGGDGDDILQLAVDAGVDTLAGDAGFDTLAYSGAVAGVVVQLSGYATSGGALIATFSGVEAAIGTAFDDALVGNGAGNELTGDAGADWLVGQGGADFFIYRGDDGQDTIADFSRNEGDRIDLSAIDSNATAPGDNAFFFSTARASGLAGQVVAASFESSTTLSVYLDTDDVADMVIQVIHQPGLVMNAGDFVL